MNSENKNLKIKNNKEINELKHFTLLADGEARELKEGFKCRPGRAVMGMKVWAADEDEAFDMIQVIGEQIGFFVDGKIELYASEPIQMPEENPYGYDINFTEYD